MREKSTEPSAPEAALLLIGVIFSAGALLAGLKRGFARWNDARRLADGTLFHEGTRDIEGTIHLGDADAPLPGHGGPQGPVLVRMDRATAGGTYRQGTLNDVAEVRDGTRSSLVDEHMKQVVPSSAMAFTALLAAFTMVCQALSCGPFGPP